MGYCHLDRKAVRERVLEVPRGAAVSPRYEPALGGVAETYQRQGNKDAAIEAWNKYLDVLPGLAEGEEAARDPRRAATHRSRRHRPTPTADRSPRARGTDPPPPPPLANANARSSEAGSASN